MKRMTLITVVLASGLVAACEKRPTPQETAERVAAAERAADPERVEELRHPVGEQAATQSESAVHRIADARCTQAERCGRLGAGKRFTDRAACLDDIRAHLRADLSSAACPGGIEAHELNECLDEIENEDCNVFDRIERLVACRSSDMCKAIR